MNEILTYNGTPISLMGREDLISGISKLMTELEWQQVRNRDLQQRVKDLSPRPLNGVGL